MSYITVMQQDDIERDVNVMNIYQNNVFNIYHSSNLTRNEDFLSYSYISSFSCSLHVTKPRIFSLYFHSLKTYYCTRNLNIVFTLLFCINPYLNIWHKDFATRITWNFQPGILSLGHKVN